MTAAAEGRTHRQAKVAVSLAFAMNGFAFASWAARTPALRDALQLSATQLGLLLLCVSGGAIAALPLSGPFVHRVGAARAVLAGCASVAAGLAGLAVGVAYDVVPLAGLGLALVGLGTATWDVAMNVEGAAVERRLGRPVMPRFHAAFSLGTVAGALVGAASAASGTPVSAQLLATPVLLLPVVARAVRAFLAPDTGPGAGEGASGTGLAWREPRTLVIGLCVLAFAFTEGVANDWLALAVVDGHGAGDTVGALAFGVFVGGMTVARLVGGSLLARWGRVPVLRGTAAAALVGLLLVVLGPALPWVLLGALVWGAGASLGFPVGMSAASDEPARAAARVSVVSSIGYTAFLAGPPLVGVLGDRVGVLRALLVVLAALLLGLATAGAAAPAPARQPAGRPATGSGVAGAGGPAVGA